MGNGFGRVFQSGIFSLPCGAIIQTKGVLLALLLARPIDADESGKLAECGCVHNVGFCF